MNDLPPVVVGPTWVRSRLGRIVLADVRWYLDGRSGFEAYRAAHLPGALFVDLDHALADHGQPATAGRHPLPAPERFAEAMAAIGIGDDTVVVAYDDTGGGTAGRLVMMLRATGHPAALLDGGLDAWVAAGGSVEQGEGPVPAPAPATFTPQPWPARLTVGVDEVSANANAHANAIAIANAGAPDTAAGPTIVLDARSAERYRGEEAQRIDPRVGHIPGAANAPWGAVLDPATKRLRPVAELREHFAALGVREGSDVICYCGSGVSACADLIALEHAGLGEARLFVPSWSGWSADPARPAATGAQP